jgi:diguanylate cyclase (GGDEF)-like protein
VTRSTPDHNSATQVAELPRPESDVKPRPRSDAVWLGLIFGIAGIAIVFALADIESVRPAAWWVPFALLAGFALAEYSVFRFVFRRESVGFSLSEIPLIFALVFLNPVVALAVRVIGSLTTIILVRRPPFHKVALNSGVFALETALAFVVFLGIVDLGGDTDTVLVLAAIAVATLSSAITAVLVGIAIAWFGGGFWQRLAAEFSVAWWLFLVNATLGAMVLGLALISPLLAIVAMVPVGLLWYVIKAFGAVDQRLRDLDDVHGFTGRVGQSLDPEEIIAAAVSRTADVLRSDGAAVVVFDDINGPLLRTHGSVGVRLPSVANEAGWRRYVEAPLAQLVAGASLDSLRTNGASLDQIIVAPVGDDSGPMGLLVVSGRNGVGHPFNGADVLRTQNLAEQLAASLRRGLLHQRIEREAREDALTGLPNRVSFEKSVIEAASRRRGDGQLFVIMLDLDRFKEVNDTLGHHAGDELLRVVGQRLSALLEPDDVLARLASDEFAIVGERAGHDEMLELAWACVGDVGRPVTLDGLEIVVTASAGLAVVEADAEEGEALRFADIAMFNAKTQRLGVEIYRDEIDRRTPARLSMLGDLSAAIENGDLHVHLQPKLDLSSGTVVGAEALVRWTHAVRGAVPPAQFVRVAEDTGLIKQLTDLMLHRGIGHLREIHDRGYHLGLAVNLSTHDLLDIRLATRVQEHLDAAGVDPAMLTLEITESSLLIDAPRARATINELHEVGVRLSIDDFGTGYSSLSYLRRLPVSELKIDQSFVANVLLDEQDEVIVRSTIDLGHNLGLVVVAEGVENNEVLERLSAFGCDIAQGYCISRPLPPQHLLSWLATTRLPSLKTDPLDFSRWVDAGEPHEQPQQLD